MGTVSSQACSNVKGRSGEQKSYWALGWTSNTEDRRRGRWKSRENGRAEEKQNNLLMQRVTSQDLHLKKYIVNIQHLVSKPSNSWVHARQSHRAMFKRAVQTPWHSCVLPNVKASLMSRLSLLLHDSLGALEILFVELPPVSSPFPVIPWLVAGDEALLSSSVYLSHVTLARLS